MLYSKDIEKESLELFIKLIENCEFARFTPASEFKINNDYENAVKVITKMLPDISRSKITAWIKSGDALINEKNLSQR